MMLLRTPQMLKTPSRVNKGNAMNNLAFIVRIVHVCVEIQTGSASAVKPHDAVDGKEEEPTLILVS